MKTTIRDIGNSKGMILPKELLARLRLDSGDDVYITETPNGFQITPYDANFAKAMEVAERVMREHRDVLKKLAE
jgi:putative addiction module antidote